MQHPTQLQKTKNIHKQKKQKFTIMFYISATKATFNPCDTNTPDTFISRGYDTREEAKKHLDTLFIDNELCIIEHDPNKMPTQRLRQPF